MIDIHIKSVPLGTIDSNDDTYRISSPPDPEWMDALAASIERLGLLQAPLIFESRSHRRIVSGFRRIAASHHCGCKEIFCRMLGPEASPWSHARLAVAENAWQRPLNLMEKARAFALLSKINSDPNQMATLAIPLGLVENATLIDKLIRLTDLPKSIQRAAETGDLGLAMALTLGTLDANESRQILKLFQTFRFGLNRQRELIELITEIAKRESLSIGQVLASDDIIGIMAQRDLDRPTRAAAFYRYLKQRRYPALTQAETEFKRLRRELGLGHRARLNPPQYFEGKTYQLILKFDTLEELKIHQQRLSVMIANPWLKPLLGKRLKDD